MSATQSDRAQRFRALHDAPATFVLPNPWDAGPARILAGLGFPALATTSAGLAMSLGRIDGLGLVSRDEALAHARSVVEATDLAVSADLENGFGADPAVVTAAREIAERGTFEFGAAALPFTAIDDWMAGGPAGSARPAPRS